MIKKIRYLSLEAREEIILPKCPDCGSDVGEMTVGFFDDEPIIEIVCKSCGVKIDDV